MSYESYEALLSIAFDFRKEKLWTKLTEMELFAVQLSSGEIGYCLVTGENGEHFALSVYVGEEGLNSLRSLYDSFTLDNMLLRHEAASMQSCLQCSFEFLYQLNPDEQRRLKQYTKKHNITLRGSNSCPMFRTYTPAHILWSLEEKDHQPLYEALFAATELSKQLATKSKAALGFQNLPPRQQNIPFIQSLEGNFTFGKVALPSRRIVDFPRPDFKNDVMIAKLRKMSRTDQVWLCDIVMQLDPMSDEETDADGFVLNPTSAPFFPYLLLVMDHEDESILYSELAHDMEEAATLFLSSIAEIMFELGLPKEIVVQNRRAENFLYHFAAKLGIKITRVEQIPLMNEVLLNLQESLRLEENPTEESDEYFYEKLSSLDDETFLSLPRGLKHDLLVLADEGQLPVLLEERILRLFHRK